MKLDQNEALEAEVVFYNYGPEKSYFNPNMGGWQYSSTMPGRGYAYMKEQEYYNHNFPSEAYPYLDTRWGDSANEGAFCIGIANSNALSPNVKYWWVIQGPVPVYINNSVFPDHYIPNEGGAKISFQRSYNYVSATLTGLGHPSNGHDTWSVFQEEYERLIQPLKFRDYKVPSRKEFNITNNELYITRSKL